MITTLLKLATSTSRSVLSVRSYNYLNRLTCTITTGSNNNKSIIRNNNDNIRLLSIGSKVLLFRHLMVLTIITCPNHAFLLQPSLPTTTSGIIIRRTTSTVSSTTTGNNFGRSFASTTTFISNNNYKNKVQRSLSEDKQVGSTTTTTLYSQYQIPSQLDQRIRIMEYKKSNISTIRSTNVLGIRTFTGQPRRRSAESVITSTTTTKRFMSSSNNNDFGGNNNGRPLYRSIGRDEMEEIIDDYEYGGREDSEYCIIDVRTDEEVITTGKLSPNVYTLPVQIIMQYNVFALDDDEFEEICGFTKPTYDETIVFSCKAGVRSVYACQFAAQAGYSKLINYTGGSYEWFATGGWKNNNNNNDETEE